MTALPTLVRTTALPTLVRTTALHGPTLVPVKDGLWRVTSRSGAVVGHIERRTDADGDRFAARRLTAATRTIDLGVFWRIDDAADCFR
ncbi:MAG: hypothetical protein JWM23_75 [Microbacteriaceae bacterium]|jgi:hypothetical protein|nr:hypothetical protein [Microbacteriaceae bacterium]